MARKRLHNGTDHWAVARGGGSPWVRPDGRYDLPRDGFTEQSYYRWRNEYRGLNLDRWCPEFFALLIVAERRPARAQSRVLLR
jgi:hypothetical protein